VITAITGRTVAQFDADFRAYLRCAWRRTRARSACRPTGLDDVTALEIAADAKPKDATWRGPGWRSATSTRATPRRPRPPRPRRSSSIKQQPIARYLMAEVTLRSGDEAGARTQIMQLIADGHDSYDLRVRLAELAVSGGDLAGAIAQLCAAKRLDPERSYPYQALAEIYKKQGDDRPGAGRARALRDARADGGGAAARADRRLRWSQRRRGPRSRPTARWRSSSSPPTPSS
jgi:predicted Zn-dependent protease